MAEYIERDKAIDLFYPIDPDNSGSDGYAIVAKSGSYSSAEIESMLYDLPAADVVPVRRGYWKLIGADKRGRGGEWQCMADGCGKLYPYKCNYCPNCGADMRGATILYRMEEEANE